MSFKNFRLLDARSLVDCAMGRKKADVVIRQGSWVSVQSGEILAKTDVAILGERIAYVGSDASHTIGPDTQVIEAEGFYLVPGLMDAHMHVESGMLTVSRFVEAVAPHGTTGMFIDPHEIGNVFGMRGVRMMVDEAAEQPIHVFVQIPSCVPSSPGMETPGQSIQPSEIAEAMQWEGVIGLGEVMNYPGVFDNDEKMHQEIIATRAAKKVVGGHYPTPNLGLPFHGYVAGGVMDDHEGTTLEDGMARVRQGMRALLRQGSAWHDVAAQIKAVTEHKLDPHRFVLCTDDCHSQTLIEEGHMDRVVRFAISQGLDPITAIQMATINTAEHFGVSGEMGMIAPCRFADILLVKDLADFHAEKVIARGKLIAEKEKLVISLPAYQAPDWARQSIHLKNKLKAEDFRLPAPAGTDGKVTANVIGVIENQAPTRHLKIVLPVIENEVKIDLNKDVAKAALVERHHATGSVQVGLVNGFGFTESCAVASTVAHDCHHMIVVGTNEAMMAQAANYLAEIGGGQVVIKDHQVIGEVRLPVGGLMSDRPAVEVAGQAETILKGLESCGCHLNNANMQISLLGLVVIPELRLSDLGLVDVSQFCCIPVLE